MPVLGGDDEGVGSLGSVEAGGVGDRLGDGGAAVDRQQTTFAAVLYVDDDRGLSGFRHRCESRSLGTSGMTATAPTGVDPEPAYGRVGMSALDLMVQEHQFETIVFFAAHHSILLSHLVRSATISLIDFDGACGFVKPSSSFDGQDREDLPGHALGVSDLDGSMDEQIQPLEETACNFAGRSRRTRSGASFPR